MVLAAGPPDCTFVVKALELKRGQVVKVVGSPPELGAWNVSTAPACQLLGDDWKLTASPSLNPFEFKLVVTQLEGGAQARWENGANRAVQVLETQGQGVQIICRFNDPASTQLLEQPAVDAGVKIKPNEAPPPVDVEPAAMTQLQQQAPDLTPGTAAVAFDGPPPEERLSAELPEDASAERSAEVPELEAAWAAANIDVVWKTEGGGSLIVLSYADD